MLRSNSRRVPPRKKSGRVSVATSRGIGFFVERDADAPDMVDDVGVAYVREQGKVERIGKEQIVASLRPNVIVFPAEEPRVCPGARRTPRRTSR